MLAGTVVVFLTTAARALPTGPLALVLAVGVFLLAANTTKTTTTTTTTTTAPMAMKIRFRT